jgi:hypothetical protein
MQIGSYRREINVWQFVFRLSLRSPWRIGFSPYFELAFLKLLRPPVEAGFLTGKDYRGILWRWSLPIPRPYRYFMTRPLYTYLGIKGGEPIPRWFRPVLGIPAVRRFLRKQYLIPLEFTFC